MAAHQLLEILVVAKFAVGVVVGEEKVVTNARANGHLFYIGVLVDFFVKFNERMMVGVEIFADVWLYAGWTRAFLAQCLVFAAHHVHIGRRAAQIAYIAFKIRHLSHLFHLM